jgi:hypothetical protein
MLRGLWPRNHSARTAWLRRLDQIAGHLNVVLVVIAIGLATLDLTFLCSEQIIDHLPQMARAFDAEPSTALPDRSPDRTGPP